MLLSYATSRSEDSSSSNATIYWNLPFWSRSIQNVIRLFWYKVLSLNFVPLIFSLTYATKDTTKGYKKGLIFLFCIPKNWYYFGIIFVWKILFEMKISLIFGENSTKCMQNIAKNVSFWWFFMILNIFCQIFEIPKPLLWVRFPSGVPKSRHRRVCFCYSSGESNGC